MLLADYYSLLTIYRYIGQMENASNPAAYIEHTGPEIWAQSAGQVDYFIHGIGTGGCTAQRRPRDAPGHPPGGGRRASRRQGKTLATRNAGDAAQFQR